MRTFHHHMSRTVTEGSLLHLVVHAFYGGNVFVLVYQLQAIACIDFDQALLNQASTDTAGAEALGEKEV